MTVLKKIAGALLLLVLGNLNHPVLAQSNPLEKPITLSTGWYAPDSVILILEKHFSSVNFNSNFLQSDSIYTKKSVYTAQQLLELCFNSKEYQFKTNKNRVIVSPVKASTIVISGFVSDQQSGERLIGASIYCPAQNTSAVTNSFGFYSLALQSRDSVQIKFNFIGFQSQNLRIAAQKNLSLDVGVQVESQQLNEVKISGKSLNIKAVKMSYHALDMTSLKQLPQFMGEGDVIRTFQLIPGVQPGNDLSSTLHVRGGSADQNLLLLDDVPVYNSSHLFGIFSVFNTDALKHSSLSKGGFSALEGGRLSSIINLNMKEGDLKETHGSASISPLLAKLTLEGPLAKNKTSYLIAGRRTFMDLLAKGFLPENTDLGYYFGDANVKVNHIVNRKHRMYASFYTGADAFKIRVNESDFKLKWANYTFALRYNHLINAKTFGNLTLTYSQFKFNTGYQLKEFGSTTGFDYFSKIEDYSAKYRLEYRLNAQHLLKVGMNYTRHQFTPGSVDVNQGSTTGNNLVNVANLQQADDLFYYAEDYWKINERLAAQAGIHYAQYFTGEQNYHSLQPRLAASYQLNHAWALKSSFSQMNQSVHQLSNSGVGLPTDLWVSSSDRIHPQQSNQVVLGTAANFKKHGLSLEVEVYHKSLKHLISYKEGANFLLVSNWENSIETNGKGTAYGLEILLKKEIKKFQGWIGYTLSKSTRTFSNINEGKSYPFKYDRRHYFTSALTYRFSSKFDIGANWVYSSGQAYTAPIDHYSLNQPDGSISQFIEYGSRNGARFKDYHRLDISVNFNKKKSWGSRTWNISIYNVYNQFNPFLIHTENSSGSDLTFYETSVLPIIPSFAYKITF